MDILEVKKLWSDVKSELRETIPAHAFYSWVDALEPAGFDNNSFSLLTVHMMAPQIVRHSYYSQMSSAFEKVFGRKIDFSIDYDAALAEKYKKEKKKESARPKSIYKEEEEDQQKSMDNLAQMQSFSNLNLKYKFENFVVGSNNKLAYVAAQTVAQHPGTKYNPLYIYGGPGLGKTHIMQAIGHYIIKNRPNMKVLFITAEEFVNDVVNALARGDEKTKKMNNFRKKYREVDVLLIDDIQLIAGKTRTEEEVFNTFNVLHGSGKQIVITSDRTPKEIPSLSDRLVSRFEWGLMADIQVPDIETRMAILQNLAKDSSIEVPNNIIEFLATVYSNNIRELEGAFNRVTAYASINDVPLDIENVKRIINYSEEEKTLLQYFSERAQRYRTFVKSCRSKTGGYLFVQRTYKTEFS